MNEDLEFIKRVIKEEIKTWTGYRREIVNDVGEEKFIKEIGIEIREFEDRNEFPITKDIILEYLDILVESFT